MPMPMNSRRAVRAALRHAWLAGLSAGLALAAPGPAAAGTAASIVCGERGAIVQLLSSRFSEIQEDLVLRSEHSLMELFVSTRGTWSILHTTPNGTSCVVASGMGLAPVARL